MMSRQFTQLIADCCVNHKVVEYIRAVILTGIKKSTSIILKDNVLPHIGNPPPIPGVSESEALKSFFSSSHSLNEVENTTVGPSIKPKKII